MTEPFIIKTGSGGAIGLGKQLKGGRWMVDQEGADVLREVETTYRNAGITPGARSKPQSPVEDERMPDEWNRVRNQQGEVIGLVGQRPVVRPMRVEEAVDVDGVGSVGDEDPNSESRVMAALARLRQSEKH